MSKQPIPRFQFKKQLITTNHQSNLPMWEFRISVDSYQSSRIVTSPPNDGPPSKTSDAKNEPFGSSSNLRRRQNQALREQQDAELQAKFHVKKGGLVITGVIKLPQFGGNQTIQIYGDFEEFRLYQCSVWVGTIIFSWPLYQPRTVGLV